ncbi:MAG: hypothetical protein HKN16_04885 [Saprospiraceae bacterium]|nr:hypothetical protein [Saprospiraceae bacterium]
MKQIFSICLILAVVQLQGQNTEVYIKSDRIGFNIANPTKFFHFEAPSFSNIDGIYSRINYTGNQDPSAVKGLSNTNPGYGIGGHFTGGFRGVYALGSGGTNSSSSFPTYGVYAEATGSAGTRIGLFARAVGGTTNLAAQFAEGDVEIENMVRINTTDQTGRLHIVNTDNIGSNATAVRINADNNGSENVYGTLVSADNQGSGNTFGHYATVSSTGTGTAFAIRAIANDPDDYAFYGTGNTFLSGDLRIGQNVEPYSGSYKVVIDGKVLAEEVRVQNSLDWPDYVFGEEYVLKSLEEVENYIEENNHLPNIPSAEEIEKEGIILGEMQTRMMEKIEELTLYIIQQQKEIDALKDQIKSTNHE